MSTNLIIALTIAVAVIANTRIVVARSAPMLPSEMLKDLESDAVSNRMVNLNVNFYSWFQPFAESGVASGGIFCGI